MVEVTAADVRTNLPEFATVPADNSVIELQIENARLWVNEDRWGESKAKLGIIYMTGHLLKELGHGSGGAGSTHAAGPVTSERVGDISRNYAQVVGANASVAEQLLGTTVYGRNFLRLRKTLIVTPMVL